MTNPRMNERNHLWKRRVTAVGVATFIALSALIGKQAEQNQTAAAPVTASIPAAAASTNVATAPTTAASTTSPTTSPSVSVASTVNTRTTSSK